MLIKLGLRPAHSGSIAVVLFALALGALGRKNPTLTARQTAELQEAQRLSEQVVKLFAEDKHDEALPLAMRSLAIRERILGPNDPNVAAILNSVAEIYRIKGDYAKAEPLHLRALGIFERSFGSDHQFVARSLVGLGLLYSGKGGQRRAEPLFQRSLAIYEKALGSDHPNVAVVLNNLGDLYRIEGSFDKALPLYQRALTICEAALGKRDPRVATTLTNLAAVYKATGDYVKAEPLASRALAIRETAFGPNHRDIAESLNLLGNIYDARGDYSRAEPLYQRAMAIREKNPGQNDSELAKSLNNLAGVCFNKGDYERAEPLYKRAIALYEKTLGPEHPNVALVLNNLATSYAASGDARLAVESLARGLDIEERHLASLLATGSEDQKQAYVAKLSTGTSITLSLHLREAPDNTQAARLALTTVLRRKGRVLDALAEGVRNLRLRATPEDQALLQKLAAARARLSGKVLKPGEKPEERPATVWGAWGEMPRREEINKIAEEVRQLEAKISARSGASIKAAPPLTLDMIQSLIPDGAALVEIVLYDLYNFKATKPQQKWGAARYAAYVIGRRGPPKWADLGESALIDKDANALRAALRNVRRNDVKLVARALDERVMAPVRKLLGDERTLLVSADGILGLVPFGAFVDEQNRYLVERYSLSYLATVRDLLRLQVGAASRQGPVVIANPNFDDDGSANQSKTSVARAAPGSRSTNLAGLAFDPLPGTAREAQALKISLRGALVLTGSTATESALKQVHGPSILHVATHGFFLPDARKERQEGAYRALFNSDPSGRVLWGENPLLRSGLALAGFNKGKSGAEDGVLTALEASGLDLSGTKLVILSACETGVGDVLNGEGVFGLRRAFAIAGAESQVMSLWQVNDESTADLMAAYYKALIAGGGRSESLRRVQLDTLHSKARQHPYFWAGFIPSGDWRSLR